MTFCPSSLQDFFARPLSEKNSRRVPALLVKSTRFNSWARLPIFWQARQSGIRYKMSKKYSQRVSALLLAQCSETARANAPCVIVWYESSSCICIGSHSIEPWHCSVAALTGASSMQNKRATPPSNEERRMPISIFWTQLMHLHLAAFPAPNPSAAKILPMRALFLIGPGN